MSPEEEIFKGHLLLGFNVGDDISKVYWTVIAHYSTTPRTVKDNPSSMYLDEVLAEN